MTARLLLLALLVAKDPAWLRQVRAMPLTRRCQLVDKIVRFEEEIPEGRPRLSFAALSSPDGLYHGKPLVFAVVARDSRSGFGNPLFVNGESCNNDFVTVTQALLNRPDYPEKQIGVDLTRLRGDRFQFVVQFTVAKRPPDDPPGSFYRFGDKPAEGFAKLQDGEWKLTQLYSYKRRGLGWKSIRQR